MLYNNYMYDIFSKLNGAIDFFDSQTVNIINSDNSSFNQKASPYPFSQRQLLIDIDLALNSIYKGGKFDPDGQRKLYLNIVRFYLNVSVKNTDVDTKNYVLSPADYGDTNMWSVWFLDRQYRAWLKEKGYAKTINECVVDFNKYGGFVTKAVRDDIIRVPLNSLKNDQTAKTLLDGVRGGTPLIETHTYSYIEMCDYKDVWNVPEYFDGQRKVYDMYVYMKREELDEMKSRMSGDKKDIKEYKEGTKMDYATDEMVLTYSVLMPTGKDINDKAKKYSDTILFIEEIDELPYNECHNEKQDGRWLGVGEVEKQLENQIAKNLSANLRITGMKNSATNVFLTIFLATWSPCV